jgi:hypothetical protein
VLWFLVWTVLVGLALALLGWLAYGVFRKGVALVREMGEAAELLGRAAEQAERLGAARAEPEPAVFSDPHQLRRERDRRARSARRADRRTVRRSRV